MSAEPAGNSPENLGPAGRMAKGWINSKLTPLLIVSSLLIGAFSVMMLPREEEPQIIVPMIDVFVQMPGASPKEVEERVTRPMEKLLWEIPGVEYIYSTSSPGMSMAIVRFKVGEDEERSIVKLNQKMHANVDLIPPGASLPLVKPRSIDDVPILAAHAALAALQRLRTAADCGAVARHHQAGAGRQRSETARRAAPRVEGDARHVAPGRLSARRLCEVVGALGMSNQRLPAGKVASGNREFMLEAGDFLRDARDAANLVVNVSQGRPVYLRDVATVEDTGEEPVAVSCIRNPRRLRAGRHHLRSQAEEHQRHRRRRRRAAARGKRQATPPARRTST